MKSSGVFGALSALVVALMVAVAGCMTVGDNCVGVAGWTVDPTNKVVMSRWVFPVYQWQRNARSSRSSKTYVLAGLAGWRVNRFGELAETWLHPVWYRDTRTLNGMSSDTVTRTTTVNVFPLVGVENTRVIRVEDPWDVTPMSERQSVYVVPGYSYSRVDGGPAEVKWLWGLFRYTRP